MFAADAIDQADVVFNVPRSVEVPYAELIFLAVEVFFTTGNRVCFTGLFMERVRRQDGRIPTPEQAFMWATRNGYRALGVKDAGWLAPGNTADHETIRSQAS